MRSIENPEPVNNGDPIAGGGFDVLAWMERGERAGWHRPFDSVRELCERSEELCRLIAAPDLDDLPIYVVAQSELRRHWRQDRCGGYTAPYLSVLLRGELERLDRWEGPGAAMVINDKVKRHRAEQLSRALVDDGLHASADAMLTNSLYRTVLHELAHVLDFGELVSRTIDETTPAAIVKAERRKTIEWLRRDDKQRDVDPWDAHACGFIRAALHIQQRADELGLYCDLQGMNVAGEHYRLSPVGAYQTALEGELLKKRGEPIRQVLRSEPPKVFLKQFLRDAMGYHGMLAADAA